MDLDDLNTTELVYLAQEVDEEVHRGLSKEALKDLIVTGEPQGLQQRHVNKVRLRIMQYITDHWKQVEPLLSCPASSRDLRACYQCTDIQVVECALTNKKNIFPKETP